MQFLILFKKTYFPIIALFLLTRCLSQNNTIHWSELPLNRLKNNPVIYPDMLGLEGKSGANINGPSVIKVPTWIAKPLGKYYMYFAHHQGKYIRLAYANHPSGPWKIHKPGVLQLEETACIGHIASPDILIDAATKTIRMYFHGPTKNKTGQKSFLATSSDGLNFTASDVQLGLPYFRVFKYNDSYYAIAKKRAETGILYRSTDGITPFEEGPSIIPRIRHAALAVANEKLYIYYSRIGDTPERILMSTVLLDKDNWLHWKASQPKEVIRPATNYEGVDLPILVSKIGTIKEKVHQLRDPALLIDGKNSYLYYTVAGELGIAVAKFDTIDSKK